MNFTNKRAKGAVASVFFLFFVTAAFSQTQVDYTKIIRAESLESLPFEEKLVRLAWENLPQNTALKKERDIAARAYSYSKVEWLNNIRITGNLNETNIDPPEDLPNLFFPRYNFSVLIPLGIISEQKFKTKTAALQVEMAEENIKSQMLAIRSEVLQLYQDYQAQQEMVRIQTQISEDQFAMLSIIEQQFEKGEATTEKYTAASNNYNLQLLQKITSESMLKKLELQLEAMIGINLEDIP